MIDAFTKELELLGHAPHDDHIPVPLAHASVVEEAAEDAYSGLALQERHSGVMMVCDNPVEVEQ